jgi:Recombination endonuclease VII
MFCSNDPFIGCMPYKNKEDQKKWQVENREHLNTWRKEYRKRVGRKDNPETNIQWRRQNRKRCVISAIRGRSKMRYGIPLKEFAEIRLRAETGVCEICGGKPSRCERSGNGILHIDHPKGERRMRGLLCHKCNTGLGSFGDNIEKLQSAIEYLMIDSVRRAYA